MPESRTPEDAPDQQVQAPDQRTDDEVYEEFAPVDEHFAGLAADRALIRTLINFIGMSHEAEIPESRQKDRVELARDWAVLAAYERIARACRADLPNFDDEIMFPIEE